MDLSGGANVVGVLLTTAGLLVVAQKELFMKGVTRGTVQALLAQPP